MLTAIIFLAIGIVVGYLGGTKFSGSKFGQWLGKVLGNGSYDRARTTAEHRQNRAL